MLEELLEFLFPAQCAGCNAVGNGLCERCFPRAEPEAFTAASLRIRSLGPYEGALRRAVLALKDGRRDVARALGERLRALARPEMPLVPIPTTRARRRERGFDGCVLLASFAAVGTRACVRNAIVQVRGDAQRGRDRTARLAAAGRFRWAGEPLEGAEVVLLDDVVTTGSTLADCAATIRAAGGVVNEAIVVARA